LNDLTDEDIDVFDIEGHECITINAPFVYNHPVYADSAQDKKRTDERCKWVMNTKSTILKNQESIKSIREWLDTLKDEPDCYIKGSEVYHSIRRMINDE